ncbi:MAG: MMPL family transporter [Crocinitomicaceae bacterium]
MGDLKKRAKVAVIGVLIVSALFAYKASGVEFDYDFEAFFSENDPETKFFEKHRKRFETDNDFIFIALQHEPSVFDQTFLQKTRDFIRELEEDSTVIEVQGITEMEEYIKTPFSNAVLSRPYIHIDEPDKYEKDSIRIFSHPEISSFFLDKNATALLLNVKHKQYLSKEGGDNLKKTIDNLLEKYQFQDFKYAGRAIGMSYYINKMVAETGMFIGLSFILVIAFLILAFRSLWGLLIPLTIVGLSMVWIVGFMGVLNEPINLILTTLPSIIFVVAMSDVMHLVSKFMEELRNGADKMTAVKTAYREVGKATLLTSLTTAIGFLTLLFVDMQPVQSFGMFTAVGVMLAFVLAYTFLPALLVLTKPPKVSMKKNTETIWYRVLHPSFIWMLNHRRKLLFAFIALTGLSIYGSSLVKSDYYLLEDLKESNDLRQTYEYFDQEFMGLRPFELAVEVVDDSLSIFDYEVLSEMNKVEEFLAKEYGIERTISLVSVLKVANRTTHGGQKRYYKFPTKSETEDYVEQFQKYDRDGQLKILVDSTAKYGRIAGSMGDVGMRNIQKMNKKFMTFLDEEVNTDIVKFKMTGTGHLLDINMSLLSESMFKGLGLAVGIVSLLMGLLFRSVKMVIIAMIPNLLPLLMLGAILGFVGIDLKVSTALVFTISFGIAVDDTIHFMSKFKLELNKGKSVMYALKRTYLSTGRAITLTTLILIGGFLMLLFSDFLGTFYIGFLISCALLFALIADLFFLPVLIVLFYNPKKKKTLPPD